MAKGTPAGRTGPAKRLTEAVMQRLDERARGFIKLDLAYVAAVGAVFTALQFGQDDVIWFWARIHVPVMILIAIGVFDLIVEMMVFDCWVDINQGVPARLPDGFLRFLTGCQPVIHMLFVGGVLTAVTSFSHGAQDARNRREGMAKLQEEIEEHMAEKGEPPNSFKDVAIAPYANREILELLQEERAVYRRVGQGYELRFRGKDGEFETEDDFLVTNSLRLRKIFPEEERPLLP